MSTKDNVYKGGVSVDYAELLRTYIKKSRLTLDEISEKLEEKGLTASKQYLSKLQNGKTAPASEKLNQALAEITDGDAHALILLAYLEKAPEEIKSDIDFYFMFNNKDGKEVAYIGEAKRSDWLKNRFAAHKKEATYTAEDFSSLNNNVLTVPVLGHIAAGLPILAIEHIDTYMDIPNPDNYEPGELFVLIVKGDSMEGSRIYEGDKVIVKVQPEVENGEIAVVNVNGDEATLKKVKKLDNGQVWLFPSNNKYDPILLDNENARVIGKVIQVIFEP
jgi:repressor LexA